ncbi:MAG: D-alanine--D-alanine ligase [Clostridia bacterium]|nr:D-alanine--D-alanine ligase [Clostridia bacterium]
MNKKMIAVIFGGRTVEHEVSIVTGHQFIENMDKTKYDVVPIYITRDGEWFTGEKLLNIENFKEFDRIRKDVNKTYISPDPTDQSLVVMPKRSGLFSKPSSIKLDAVVLAMHGLNGEDGSLQGLLELANIPYVSPGILAASVGMDKIVMKSVFKGNDIPILEYDWFLRSEYQKDKQGILDMIEEKLSYPMFVKPANLGSSIGISKAKDRKGLEKGIEIAIRYDKRIVVEQGIDKPIEINCSVVGYDDNIEASVCEQPISWEDFLSYEDKYIRGNSSKGMKGSERKIPAPIGEELTKEIQDLALQSFRAIDGRGVARIDFLLDEKDMKPYVNEINTIPGSFSYYLWEPKGIKYKELIDRLIDHAFEIHREKNKNTYSFDSKMLDNIKAEDLRGVKK